MGKRVTHVGACVQNYTNKAHVLTLTEAKCGNVHTHTHTHTQLMCSYISLQSAGALSGLSPDNCVRLGMCIFAAGAGHRGRDAQCRLKCENPPAPLSQSHTHVWPHMRENMCDGGRFVWRVRVCAFDIRAVCGREGG